MGKKRYQKYTEYTEIIYEIIQTRETGMNPTRTEICKQLLQRTGKNISHTLINKCLRDLVLADRIYKTEPQGRGGTCRYGESFRDSPVELVQNQLIGWEGPKANIDGIGTVIIEATDALLEALHRYSRTFQHSSREQAEKDFRDFLKGPYADRLYEMRVLLNPPFTFSVDDYVKLYAYNQNHYLKCPSNARMTEDGITYSLD